MKIDNIPHIDLIGKILYNGIGIPLSIILAVMLWMLILPTQGCTVSGSFEQRGTPFAIPSPVAGIGNGVFVKDRLTHKRGIVIGTKAKSGYVYCTPDDCIYTVRFDDGSSNAMHKYELEVAQ